jgi:hypothetical protein
MFILSLLIIVIFIKVASTTATCDSYNCSLPYYLFCYEFSSWSELNEVLNTIHDNCQNTPYFFAFQPSKPILLTDELNITIEFKSTPDNIFSSLMEVFSVSGFNVYPWPALHCNKLYCQKITIIFYLSTVKFHVNNTSPDDYSCSSDIIPNDSSKRVSLFSTYLESITIEYGNTYGSSGA